VPTFFTGNTSDIPIWLTAAKRWQTRSPKINLWAGGFFLSLTGENQRDGWIFHSGATIGTREKNISPGVFVGSFDPSAPPFRGMMLNGQVRLWQKTWLICENYLGFEQKSITPICLWGFRKKTKKVALELALGWIKTRPTDQELLDIKSRYIPFPWFSAVFNLPRKPEMSE
jgi:hypothetical protein